MQRTRAFKSGNSLAVRIPKDLAFLDPAQDIEIERVGNTLVLRPVQEQTLADLPSILAAFSPDFMATGREAHEQAERNWG
ncbi:MAG: virulence protein [Burkholderiales bacterium 66-5]|uniref:antitoxin n=1 Tax=Comamonas badia TaxID=265291 RepID=UPI000423E84F|nr:type II toxin-antitoxin system VapB family antitoxin [Comamonas badia]OJU92652.1 MAG: virulence protein [Burkholderiales bacterium 66-5]